MIKSLVAASVITLAFGGTALAQATVTGAPAGEQPVTQEPNGSGAAGMPHHRRHYSHHAQRHHMRHAPGSAAPGTTQP